MFLILNLGVHDHSKDLDVGFREDLLSFNAEGFRIRLVRFAGEVYDGRLLRLECSAAPSLLI